MIERQRPHSKVSLEDLLRLKRAERPAPEFWAEFDAQLRRKQLAAIVDKRPWWRRLSTASLARISIPVGATAVIAFTLVMVRERTQSVPGNAPITASAAVSSSSSGSTKPTHTIQSSEADVAGSLVAASDHQAALVTTNASAMTAPASVSAPDRSLSGNNDSVVAIEDAPETSLAQVILGLEGTTESDARPQFQSDAVPLLASLDVFGSASAHDPSSLESSPLTQVSAPRDDRRARLLASVDTQDRGDLVSGNSRVVRSRERIANRLAEQSLYDSISRLGLNGDSVSIKF